MDEMSASGLCLCLRGIELHELKMLPRNKVVSIFKCWSYSKSCSHRFYNIRDSRVCVTETEEAVGFEVE